MKEQQKGIGYRYQQETKYSRTGMMAVRYPCAQRSEPFKHYGEKQAATRLSSFKPDCQTDFWQTVAKRRSHRDFTGAPVTFDELSLLLFATQGITGQSQGYPFRSSPSAGALYPIETYVLVNRVEKLSSGIYHYNILNSSLELIREGDFAESLAEAALGQVMIAQGGATFIWSALPARSMWKYHDRAYRYVYLDAGHIGQNLYLAATALDLGCCTIGAFFDDEVNSILEVDGDYETAVYMGVVGKLYDKKR